MTNKLRTAALVAVLGIVVIVSYGGFRFGSRIVQWRHLDATYSEEFPAPAEIAPELRDQRMLFKIKTGLKQDDSQICVGFNIIFAAIEAGADVTVLFDSGAVADLGGNLSDTGVPLRLKKIIAAQMKLPLQEMPADFGAYLTLLHNRGAEVYANTAMLIVMGDREKVNAEFPAYPFIQPATYAKIAALEAAAETVIVY